MKKFQLSALCFMTCVLLTGCIGTDTGKIIEVKTVDISQFPTEEIECVKEPDFETQVPEQEIVTESSGSIMDYLVQGDDVYYLVAYDYIYHDFCNQFAIVKQSLKDQKIEMLSQITLSYGIDGMQLYYDQNLYWTAVSDQEGMDADTLCRFDVIDGKIVESEVKIPDVEDTGWQQTIEHATFMEHTNFVADNDSYIVWEQWDGDAPTTDGEICVYSKKDKEVRTIQKKEYGSVYTPAVVDSMMVFLTIDDVKSYEKETDAYDNVYMVLLDTMEVTRITENYGNEDSLETIFYDRIHASDGTIYFTAKVHDGEKISYDKLYYMEVEE